MLIREVEQLHQMLISRGRNQGLIINEEVIPANMKDNESADYVTGKQNDKQKKRTERGRKLQRTREKL